MIRSTDITEECPTNNFERGKPNGKCWGDGHFECNNCACYREDFNRLGQEYIDFTHQIQNFQITTLKL